jgi:hypothetical protein
MTTTRQRVASWVLATMMAVAVSGVTAHEAQVLGSYCPSCTTSTEGQGKR